MRRLLYTVIFVIISVAYIFAQSSSYQRIVSLGPPVTEQLFLLGVGDRVVGVTLYCERPKEATQKTKIGTVLQPDLEKVVGLKPDLVLATPLTNVKSVAALQQLGIKVLTIPSSKDFQGLCEQFIQLAKVVGKEEIAHRIVLEAQQRVNRIMELPPLTPKPKVFVQLGANPLFTANKEYFVQDFIVKAGGVNIAAEANTGLYSVEKVIEQNPDVILITLMGVDGEREKKNWQRYKTLNAVRKNRIYFIDPYKSCSPNPLTFAETLEEIAKLLRSAHE